MKTMLEWALHYHAQGFAVVPTHTPHGGCDCGLSPGRGTGKCDAKRPHVTWSTDKRPKITEQDVREWWTRRPNANIAILTGARSGLFVVDLDEKPGVSGQATWDTMPNAGDPVTLTTGSGGTHMVYAHPGGLGTTAGVVGPGVDTRGDGGLFIAPPSVHASGGVYSWDTDQPPIRADFPPPPDWLATKMQKKARIDADPVQLPGTHTLTREDLEKFVAFKAKFTDEKAVLYVRVGRAVLDGTVWTAHKGSRRADLISFLGALRHWVADAFDARMDPHTSSLLFAECMAALTAQGVASATDCAMVADLIRNLGESDASFRGTVVAEREAAKAARANMPDGDMLVLPEQTPSATRGGRVKPRFNVACVQPNAVLDELVKELAHESDIYSDNCNRLARMIRTKEEFSEPVVIEPVTTDWLLPKLCDIADWYLPGKEDSERPVTATKDITTQLMGRRNYPGVRDIRGVVMSPFFRQDGTLCVTEGYDAKSGMWLSLSGLKLPPIPEHPTQEEARQSIAALRDLIRDFMFEDPAMSSIWLSLVLTPLARPRHSPVHLADAANPGTGKGLFCESAMQIAIGQKMTKPWPASEDERAKMLVASAVKGSPVFWLDNISPDLMLEGGAFEGAVTDGSTGRVLGASIDSPPITRTTFIANGNNVRMSPDVMRRTLRCTIVADVANPSARPESSFHYPRLKEYIQSTRARYMAAALTVLRAYYAAGKPPQPVQAIAFPEWSRDVASAIVWAGEPDPSQFLASLGNEVDEKTDALTTLLTHIEKLCQLGDGTMRAGQLCTLQVHDNPEHEAVMEAMSVLGVSKTPIEPAQVGRLLTKIRGTIVKLRDGREVRLFKTESASNNKSYWIGPPPKRNKPSKL